MLELLLRIPTIGTIRDIEFDTLSKKWNNRLDTKTLIES